jgi:tRNA threonylcarbamoyladenosine biosynthesis protein TsaB
MLTLALETSTARYGLALGEGGRVLFDSAMLGEAAGRDLGELLLTGLARAGAQIADIGAIAVDIGPGSLGSLRDGVAFANGLAYARGLPVYAYTAFELMGVAADAKASRPALCVRRANEGLAYAGTFDGVRVTRMRHGALETIVRDVAGDAGALVAAGNLRVEAAALLGCDIAVSEIDLPAAATMIAIGVAGRSVSDALLSPVMPLHEASPIFHD